MGGEYYVDLRPFRGRRAQALAKVGGIPRLAGCGGGKDTDEGVVAGMAIAADPARGSVVGKRGGGSEVEREAARRRVVWAAGVAVERGGRGELWEWEAEAVGDKELGGGVGQSDRLGEREGGEGGARCGEGGVANAGAVEGL